MPLLGVIFDFDGVIADTEPLHLKAYQDVLANTSFTLNKETYYSDYLGFDDIGVFTSLAKNQGITLDDVELIKLVELKSRRFASLLKSNQILFPGTETCIKQLASFFPLAISSGALLTEIETILNKTKLRHYFKVIVSANDTKRSKPEPDPYLLAVELLTGRRDLPSQNDFIAVEDSLWGIQSAKRAGLKCIGVTHSYPADALIEADLIVPNLFTLKPDLLEQLCARINNSRQPNLIKDF